MSYPFRTRAEVRTNRDAAPQTGVRVTFPNDARHFFPGPTAAAALDLARLVCPGDLLNAPGTTLEFGERLGAVFVLKQHLGGPKLSPSSEWEPPRVITPDVTNLR